MSKVDEKPMYREKHFSSWNKLLDYYLDHRSDWDRWIFRGQSKSKWSLQSTLERAVLRFKTDLSKTPGIEAGLLRRFKRQLHEYRPDVPAKDDVIEWLALMQHHGGPTRLLDWTYSFFVAVFFAIESAKPGKPCAVWALDPHWWEDKAIATLPKDVRALINKDPYRNKPGTIKAIFRNPQPFIVTSNPVRLNPRLFLQQGVFLAPGDVTKTFMDNMQALLPSDGSDIPFVKLRISTSASFLELAIKELHKMNLNRATLFPGLDGFAENLKCLMAIRAAIAFDNPNIFDE